MFGYYKVELPYVLFLEEMFFLMENNFPPRTLKNAQMSWFSGF